MSPGQPRQALHQCVPRHARWRRSLPRHSLWRRTARGACYRSNPCRAWRWTTPCRATPFGAAPCPTTPSGAATLPLHSLWRRTARAEKPAGYRSKTCRARRCSRLCRTTLDGAAKCRATRRGAACLERTRAEAVWPLAWSGLPGLRHHG
jgi:hypothetical protein